MDGTLESNAVFVAKGKAFMIDLFLFILAGLVLLIVFVFLGLQGPPKTDADASALTALGHMVVLEGPSFVQGDRLLDDAEYRLLKSNPDLNQVAARLRRDRRELALLWINALLKDLDALWRFRQFVIQRGAPTKFGEEWVIIRSFVVALVFLNLLKLSVLTLGPFAFARIARHAYRPVDAMSQAAASALGRIPSTGWPDLERAWTRTAA
jgi:hypothetical protein